MHPIKIDFNKPQLIGKEFDYITDAIDRSHISGDGFYTKQCQVLLEKELHASKVILTTSCTHALEMSAILSNIDTEDEVIIPSFTFVSTVNAFVLRGAKPVFVDIRADTLNIDENLLRDKINQRTKAIVPVHYAGVGCEMDSILATAREYDLTIIEDNAHGLFGKYKGKHLGTFGSMATQSFHETKNITCGEGGAIILNDTNLIERAEIIREKGTNRSKFFRGMIDKYTWVDIGSSYLPSDILAAFLYAQLESRELIQNKRRQIWEYYDQNLNQIAINKGIGLPHIPNHCQQAYHMYYLLLPDLETRQRLIAHLKESGIISVFHYLPLHLSDMGKKFGGKLGDCPITESISDRILRLPFYNTLSHEQQDHVINTISNFSM